VALARLLVGVTLLMPHHHHHHRTTTIHTNGPIYFKPLADAQYPTAMQRTLPSIFRSRHMLFVALRNLRCVEPVGGSRRQGAARCDAAVQFRDGVRFPRRNFSNPLDAAKWVDWSRLFSSVCRISDTIGCKPAAQ